MVDRSSPLPRTDYAVIRAEESALATNKVLRNTYWLLSLTLLCTAGTAWLSMELSLPRPGILITLAGYFGLLFLTYRLRDSIWGLASIFALTGFMGLTLGPLIAQYVKVVPNGHELVLTAFGATGVIFLSLSALAVGTRRNFGFMGNFLAVALLLSFLLGIVAYAFEMPTMALAVSGMFALFSSGVILWQTSEIIHGGETNYIMATITLWVSIYNLFTSLLHILGVFGGDD
jgi:modulator of FtsH protease